MILLKGHELGYEVHVLSENKNDPAAQVTQHWHQGSYHDKKVLFAFLKKMDVITFESEFINCDLLESIVKETSFKRENIIPSLENMKTFQDRLYQKELFQKYSIPTSEFYKVDSPDDLNKHGRHFKYRYVLKKRFGGYDGYGTFIVKNYQDHKKNLELFSQSKDQNFIIEKFIQFENELACQFFRNAKGDFFHFQLVQSFQKNSKCDWVMGPVSHPRFRNLITKIKKMMAHRNYIGTLAFEFFNMGDELLVNESAPRVHNSGHYTLNYPLVDQFTLHLKCCLMQKLPPLEKTPKFCFVMTNLIGTSHHKIQIPENLTGFLHLYGKSDNRPGRKMGHLNYIDKDSPQNRKNLLRKALKERKKIKL